MENTNQFLGTERVGKLMRRYAVPCIISLLVGALYNIVDQIFIANASYLGSYGNAANSVVFPLTVLALGLAHTQKAMQVEPLEEVIDVMVERLRDQHIRRLKDGYDVLDKLYDDNDLNCDNFAQAVREYRCSHEVITAVANLYLRQQIMIDTY